MTPSYVPPPPQRRLFYPRHPRPRVFLSHTWQSDTSGRDTHQRVKQLNDALCQCGTLTTWFDETDMHGNITLAMCNGIDQCDVVVVCITRAYIDKCNASESNNCGLELNYAYERKRATRLIPIVMEACCLDTHTWNGTVGAYLNKLKYFSFVKDDELDTVVDSLKSEVLRTVSVETHRLAKSCISQVETVHLSPICGRVQPPTHPPPAKVSPIVVVQPVIPCRPTTQPIRRASLGDAPLFQTSSKHPQQAYRPRSRSLTSHLPSHHSKGTVTPLAQPRTLTKSTNRYHLRDTCSPSLPM